MRRTNNVEKTIVCPFLKWVDENHIACEGVDLTDTVCLNFSDSKKSTAYKNRYCRSMNGYKECRICKMLEEKWADDGK